MLLQDVIGFENPGEICKDLGGWEHEDQILQGSYWNFYKVDRTHSHVIGIFTESQLLLSNNLCWSDLAHLTGSIPSDNEVILCT